MFRWFDQLTVDGQILALLGMTLGVCIVLLVGVILWRAGKKPCDTIWDMRVRGKRLPLPMALPILTSCPAEATIEDFCLDNNRPGGYCVGCVLNQTCKNAAPVFQPHADIDDLDEVAEASGADCSGRFCEVCRFYGDCPGSWGIGASV